MKKKLAAMILTLALAAGVMAPVPAYADGITVEETSMDTATEKSFDTDYTVKWDADKVYWNKVTLDQQGILRIHLNEEDPKSLENYDVAVYTAKGEKIWKIMVDCAGAAADNYVGLIMYHCNHITSFGLLQRIVFRLKKIMPVSLSRTRRKMML